jgi:hypothetical protein
MMKMRFLDEYRENYSSIARRFASADPRLAKRGNRMRTARAEDLNAARPRRRAALGFLPVHDLAFKQGEDDRGVLQLLG